jgi:hypothetical protein
VAGANLTALAITASTSPAMYLAVLGIASVASTQTGTDAADPAYRGVASGVLNSAAQVGTAVGVALLLPLATVVGLDPWRATAPGSWALARVRWQLLSGVCSCHPYAV